jgi:hypothetical protein
MGAPISTAPAVEPARTERKGFARFDLSIASAMGAFM